MGDKIEVSRVWYEAALQALSGKFGCPFCGSTEGETEKPGDETFHPRKGCLDCSKWWTPEQLRNP